LYELELDEKLLEDELKLLELDELWDHEELELLSLLE
jgi:hypothetical protein